MKKLFIPFLLTVFFISCISIKKLKELNHICGSENFSSVSTAQEKNNFETKNLLIIVKGTKDENSCGTCRLLNLETHNKEDQHTIKVIGNEYNVVELTKNSFKAEIPDSFLYYKGCSDFVEQSLKLDSSFVFISPGNSVYSPHFLNDKEGIKDMLWVGFGP